MNKLFERDFADLLPEMQLNSNEGWVSYHPHQAVYHAKVPGEIRVVMRVFCSFFFWGGGGCCIIASNYKCLFQPLVYSYDFDKNGTHCSERWHKGHVCASQCTKEIHSIRFLWWKDGHMDVEPKQFRTKVHIYEATSTSIWCHNAYMFCCQTFLTPSDKLMELNWPAVFTWYNLRSGKWTAAYFTFW